MDKSEKKKYRGGGENKFFEKLKDIKLELLISEGFSGLFDYLWCAQIT